MCNSAKELNESTEKTVVLDEQVVTTSEFNDRLRELGNSQRIIETSTDNYTTITRMHG